MNHENNVSNFNSFQIIIGIFGIMVTSGYYHFFLKKQKQKKIFILRNGNLKDSFEIQEQVSINNGLSYRFT